MRQRCRGEGQPHVEGPQYLFESRIGIQQAQQLALDRLRQLRFILEIQPADQLVDVRAIGLHNVVGQRKGVVAVPVENAERREARLEKEKAAEKATGRTEAKGGIHGKLEKAKAEIKAKGTDTIPKNRAKDLASVL